MTFTPVEDWTPAMHVGHALAKTVDDAFTQGVSLAGREWLEKNRATAAKFYRFHNAMAWFWADQIIQAEGITEPAPDEFMPIFREAVFTKACGFFPNFTESGRKMLWAMLYDDDDKTPGLVSEVVARKPAYLTHALMKEWMAAQGVDVDLPQHHQMSMMTTMSAPTADQVRAALKAGG